MEKGTMRNAEHEPEARPPLPDAVEVRMPSTRRPRGAASAPTAEEPTLRELARTLSEHRWTVAAVTFAALAVAEAYLFVATPAYRSSVLLQVESRSSRVLGFQEVAGFFDPDTPAEGEMRIMRSRPLLEGVIGQLGLDVDAHPRRLPLVGGAIARRYEGSAPAPARFGLDRFAWGGERIRVKRLDVPEALEGTQLVLTALGGGRYRVARDAAVLVEGEVGSPATSAGREPKIELLVSELNARPGTQFLVTRQRRIDVVEELQHALSISPHGKHTGLVEVELAGRDPARVAAILGALAASCVRQSVERTSADAANALQVLEAQIPTLKSNVDKAERAVRAFRQKNGTLSLPLETEALLDRIAEVDRAMAENELRKAELTRRYTERHPEIEAAEERIATLRIQRAATEARMRALPDVELASTNLSRQVRIATELYLLVVNRVEELRIVKSGWIGNVRVLESAVVPYRPVRPNRRLVVVLATFLGLAGGIAAAFLRNALDDRPTNVEEIEAGAGVPVLATIARSAAQRRLARRGRRGRLFPLSEAEPADAAVEDLRALRTSVQFALLRAHNKVVVVGGLAPRAGKSFVSVNLAHLLASADGRVVLVDGDLRGGGLHRCFGLEPRPGLSEMVSGAAKLDEAVRRTETPNLDLLPAGGFLRNPSELLAGLPLQEILSELGRRYDAVIVDTPPILSVTDSALVGRWAGVNLLVLRAGQHPIAEIRFGLRRFAQNGVAIRGVIMNDLVAPNRRYYASPGYRPHDASAARPPDVAAP